jgi:ABC-type transport system involved in cytochrome c biogenesis permease subunit
MPILRLAYATQFLIAVIAVFVLWSQVGGQGHIDLMPWYLKLGLGGGAAFAVVKATMAAVEGKAGWNGGSLKWFGILLALLVGCGVTTYYYHLYAESDEEDQEESVTSQLVGGLLALPAGLSTPCSPAPERA